MKRILAIVQVIVLVAGTLVLPILHLAHCHDHDGCAGQEGHDSSHCPLCQLVNAPIHDAAPLIEPVAAPAPYVFFSLPPRLVPPAVSGDSTQARAPPVA
jgi:hypothetical protein